MNTTPPQVSTISTSTTSTSTNTHHPRVEHENVSDILENGFKKMDKMYTNGELRVFGDNSDSIFEELDLIRRKQIALAIEHIALENLPDEEISLSRETTEDSEENFKRNSERFAKKEQDLNNLMNNLNNLMVKILDNP
ncbi:3510_t:CDS:2 [Diversispora eburnea]|uniref:3510_t:CDS:1 n=1 Tax=Diversispora eburnea TaxID=1213867 RepID=A0A9N9BZT1_9GLOM|nr:3510_t:CDS:2 [Diversispora eburnea]